MSDIEEVVLTRNTKTSTAVKKDTKPEIARQKMKEKRERLKKEKEDAMINEAKRRLAEDLESKKMEEIKKKHEEEEKLKNDPIHQIRMMLEKLTTLPPPPIVKGKLKRQTAQSSEPVYVEPRASDNDADSESEIIQMPVVKPKRVYKKKVVEPKEVVQPVPKASKPPPKPRAPRKKKVTIEESPTNQFYGTAPQAEQQQVYYEPTNPLLEKLAQRRRMGSYY